MRTILRSCTLSFASALAGLLLPVTLAAQTADETLALQYIPAVVADAVSGSEIPAEVDVSVARVDLDGTGNADYLVAAYAGAETGALRILRLTPAVAVVADSTQSMGGNFVTLGLPDVDADGTSELEAEFTQWNAATVTWIFKWTGGQLVPMTAGGIPGCLLIDLDGDAMLEAIGNGIDGPQPDDEMLPPIARHSVYELAGGTFVRSEDLLCFTVAVPVISPMEGEFAVPDPSVPYVVRLINGNRSGADRILSGEIRLNGDVIFDSADLGGAARVLEHQATLAAKNTLSIDASGPADGHLIVAVAFAGPYAAPPVAPLPPCVWDEGDGLFTASFGFNNPGGEETIVVRGPANMFTPAPLDRGQPVRFLPGVHASEFWVQSNGETLTWGLNGIDAVASLDSPRCAGESPAPRVHAANCTPGEKASPDPNEIVWIDDDGPAGATPLPWTDAESNSGARSIHAGYAAGERTISAVGATEPFSVRPSDRLVFYLLPSACLRPEELQVRWRDAAGGWHGAWWGEPLLNDEGSLAPGGPMPVPGDWTRLEIEASALASGPFLIDGLEIRLFGGEAWLDRFAVVPAPPSVATLTMPPTIRGGDPVTATVTLSSPAPGDGTIVTLSSDTPAVVPPGIVFVEAGATSATFEVFTLLAGQTTTAVVTASANGEASASLIVTPQSLGGLTIEPSTVEGGESVEGTATLERRAAADTVVTLASSNPEVATVPSSIVIARGTLSQTFPIQTAGSVSSPASATITAAANGTSHSATLTVTPCQPDEVYQPYLPETDSVWFSDALPEGASFQNNNSATSVGWDPSQYADGVHSISTAFGGNAVRYGFSILGLDQPVAIDENVVFYLLINPCAPPRELMIRWYSTNSMYTTYRVTYWGTPEIGGEGGGVDMGPMPEATGEWLRMEIPAWMLQMEQARASRIDVYYAGGQVWLDRFGKSGAVCIPAASAQPQVPDGDTVWFDDALPAGASFQNNGSATSIHWDASQSASGTQSIVSEYAGDGHKYGFFINGLSQPVAIGENVVFYVRLNECAPPRELMIRWYNTASGYALTYWGTEELGGESGGINMGPMPEAAGEWTRIEIPASLLRAEQGTVTRLDINYAGGQMWFDRFGKSGTACIAGVAPPPTPPAGETIWVDDSLPAGAFLQNGYHGPVHWDASQKATGTQALVNNWSGALHYESYISGLDERMEIGERVVAYFMINECAIPREIQLAWDTNKGTYRAYWGEALVGGENDAVNMGAIPAAGQWVRVELPASAIVEQSNVWRIRVIHHGGQVWFDRFGKTTNACVAAPAPPPTIPGGETIWVDDSVPAGAFLQNGYHGPAHWDASQKATGTQALVNNWSGALHYESYISGLDQRMEIGERVVAYFMINECAIPREIQLAWDTNKGTYRAFWGEALVGGENDAVNMGPIPAAGQWVRVELPASAIVEQSNVWRIRVIHHGGQVWFDRFGKTTNGCVAAPAPPPTIPAGETIWVDDSVPAGAFLQNGYHGPVHWDASQKATGTQALVNNWSGALHYESYVTNLNQRMEIGERVVAYFKINECAIPREIQLAWDTNKGTYRAFWGEALVGGENDAVNMGPMPAAGQWIRVELPASPIVEQANVLRIRLIHHGGQVWFDRLGKTGTPCIEAAAPPPTPVPGDTVWVDDSVPAGAQLQNGYHGPVHWDPSQKASGTQALVNHWSGSYHYESYVTGLAEWMEIGDRVVAHFMINECAVPREIQLVWDTDKGTHRAFWGEALVGGENGAVDMGPVPAAGQWVRVELPSAPVVEQVTVRRIRLIHHGGQVWYDRLGKNTTP